MTAQAMAIGPRRIRSYLECLLVATLLSLFPPAAFADFIAPDATWQAWAGADRQHSRPALLVAEERVFHALAYLPGAVCQLLTGLPTAYSQGSINPASPPEPRPPLWYALQHVSWAIPTWLVVLVAGYETVGLFRGRARRRSRVA